jgi:hypothetical protein
MKKGLEAFCYTKLYTYGASKDVSISTNATNRNTRSDESIALNATCRESGTTLFNPRTRQFSNFAGDSSMGISPMHRHCSGVGSNSESANPWLPSASQSLFKRV